MKNIIILLIIDILLLIIFSGCDDDRKKIIDIENMSCSDCYSEIPAYVRVDVEFSYVTDGIKVFYTIYQGNAFKSEIYEKGESDQRYLPVYLPPDRKYTIVAEYQKNGKKYLVVNDCYPRTEYLEDACDEDCYYVHETKCNLTLEYY